MLGTKDDLVSPGDCIDLVTGSTFVYLDVPFSDHLNVIDMKEESGVRTKVLKEALTLPEKQLRALEVVTSDSLFQQPDASVTDVVFVIHGIRDTGYWTQKIASRVKRIGDQLKDQKYATETSSYGYFPILSFLLNYQRRVKVEWLMDQYTENLAMYPNASFSFIGHSNGTYLLAKALDKYPACKFKNVVLAGSVVRSSYDWEKLIEQKRVNSIYNFVATSDLVVGVFPKTFQFFGHLDLGGAGFDGFTCLPNHGQFKCISGGHGAAIEEPLWDEIAHIAVHGQPSDTLIAQAINRSRGMTLIGRFAPLILILLIGVLVLLGSMIISSNLVPGWKVTLLVIYFFVLYKLFTWY